MSAPSVLDPGPALRSIAFVFLLSGYLIFSVFLVWFLANHDYETEYLALGSLVVRGEINLYQDEMSGQWVPLPFYFYGASQVLLGPSLLIGRLLSVALGAVVLALVFALASRWGGPAAGAAAGALFCTQGLVMGYFSTVHFAGLVATLHLVGALVLFSDDARRRDLIAMAIFSLLFLAKPNFWPAVPFVLCFVLWRATSARHRLALVAVAVAIPAMFFVWDDRHLKMLAYVPVLRDWVEPLGYHSWHSLTEDAEQVAASDYAAIPWSTSPSGRLGASVAAIVFLVKRYALWTGVFVGLAAAVAWGAARGRTVARVWGPGVAFTLSLFLYTVVCQFVVMGPYAKQAVGYVGAVAPLLAVALGCIFAAVAVRPGPADAVGRVLVTLVVVAVLLSPWLHRNHNLPRTLALPDSTIATLGRIADRLAALIPPGETRVFSMADAMPVHLAGRRAYLQQFSQERLAFTSLTNRARYRRVGMWGPSELEEWLGTDARYAILEDDLVDTYRNRAPYREILTRMDALVRQRFTLVETIQVSRGNRLLVYRRNGLLPMGTVAPGPVDVDESLARSMLGATRSPTWPGSRGALRGAGAPRLSSGS